MKKLILAVLAAAALWMPAVALSAEAPPPIAPFLGPGGAESLGLSQQQQQAIGQVFMSAHSRVGQLHAAARTQILSLLAPQQRSLLAQVVGNLAVAPNPDPEAAAQQIQASLTSEQSQRILSLHSGLEQQVHQTMTSAMNQANSILTQQQRQKLQQETAAHMGMSHPGGPGPMGMGPGSMRSMETENPQTAAGHLLLFMAMHSDAGFGMGWHMGHERRR